MTFSLFQLLRLDALPHTLTFTTMESTVARLTKRSSMLTKEKDVTAVSSREKVGAVKETNLRSVPVESVKITLI